MQGEIIVSIVSHGHGHMVNDLCNKLLNLRSVKKVILTLNIPENLAITSSKRLVITRNPHPKGFGANHNAAFSLCDSEFFVILNPDISFDGDIFELLRSSLKINNCNLIVPLVLSPNGDIEDSVRFFPTPYYLLQKLFGKKSGNYSNIVDQFIYVEWAAGMFMFFDSSSFADVGGFDEKFYLYYEDVDIGARFWKNGFRIGLCSSAKIIHDAQRSSRRNFVYMLWHMKSMIRYFLKHLGRLPRPIANKY
jgi:N-acetylglucosaminyl-diphospho-decaprenol L-rhamnosyltransferase